MSYSDPEPQPNLAASFFTLSVLLMAAVIVLLIALKRERTRAELLAAKLERIEDGLSLGAFKKRVERERETQRLLEEAKRSSVIKNFPKEKP